MIMLWELVESKLVESDLVKLNSSNYELVELQLVERTNSSNYELIE